MLPAEDISYPSSDSLHPTELGRGGFGVVLLGLYRVQSLSYFLLCLLLQGRKVAVKRLLNVTDTGELRSLQNEINLLSSPQHKHKNLIRLMYGLIYPICRMLTLITVASRRICRAQCWFWYWIKRSQSTSHSHVVIGVHEAW